MKVYLAGGIPKHVTGRGIRPRALVSFFNRRQVEDHVAILDRGEVAELFLDSGAYSAWMKGKEIAVAEYSAFLRDRSTKFHVYANLDVIGNPERTWANQKAMERVGLRPLPCFHYGEDVGWLRKYAGRYDYLALGGMVPLGLAEARRWLDWIFQFPGMPGKKVHGFGMTTFQLLGYPWYSVDSTDWKWVGKYGGCYIPIGGGRARNVVFSPRHGSRRDPNGKHFQTLSAVERRAVCAYVERRGFTIEQLASDYKKRDQLNVLFFLELEQGDRLSAWAPHPSFALV